MSNLPTLSLKFTLSMLMMLVAGCVTQQDPAVKTNMGDVQVSAASSTKQYDKSLASTTGTQLQKRPLKSSAVTSLLAAAEDAMLKGRLTLPEHDNAYDRFRAASLLEPGNKDAELGMERVLLAYVARVHQAVRAGRLNSAHHLARRAASFYPGNPIALNLQKTVAEARASLQEASSASVGPQSSEAFDVEYLDSSDVKQRNDKARQHLFAIAQRLQETNEGVLIIARSDRDGRWIYRVLKESADGYLIRGDIQLGKQSAIRFREPFVEPDNVSSNTSTTQRSALIEAPPGYSVVKPAPSITVEAPMEKPLVEVSEKPLAAVAEGGKPSLLDKTGEVQNVPQADEDIEPFLQPFVQPFEVKDK